MIAGDERHDTHFGAIFVITGLGRDTAGALAKTGAGTIVFHASVPAATMDIKWRTTRIIDCGQSGILENGVRHVFISRWSSIAIIV